MSDNLQDLAAEIKNADPAMVNRTSLAEWAERLRSIRVDLAPYLLPRLGIDDGPLPPLADVLPTLERVEEGTTLSLPVGFAAFTSTPAEGALVSLEERAEVQA